ncbi:TPA: hypothetical protein ACLGU7_005110, partial [Salmonella enterica]
NVGGNMLLSGGVLNILNSNLNGTGTTPQAFALQAGSILTLGNTSINAGSGTLDINLLGANSGTGMINVTRSNLSSNGGNISLDHLSHTGRDAWAMTVKIDGGSNLNASGSAANGSIRVRAKNPDINLSVPEYNNTVRNGGALIGVTNSILTGDSITVTGNLSGASASALPLYLNNATLTAQHDITLTGNGSPDSQA